RDIAAGLDEGDLRPDSWHIAADGQGTLVLEGVTIHSPLRGSHNLRNAMLAIAVARECGVPLEQIARGIAAAQQPPMRAAWDRIGSVTVINDAYNANPASMRAAIEMLTATEAP